MAPASSGGSARCCASGEVSMPEPIVVTQSGAVITVTLNRPETRNILVPDLVEALLGALDAAERDPGVSCLVLAGRDGAFCGGGNLRDMRDRTGFAAGGPADIRDAMLQRFQVLT